MITNRPPIKHDTSDWGPAEQAGFLQSLLQAGNGEVKLASEGATSYTKRILREASFFPALLKLQPVDLSKLRRVTSQASGVPSEIGYIEVEMEPGSPGSRTAPFSASPDFNTYRGEVYYIYLSKDDTPELYKNVDQLATYQMDLRQVVTDNLLKDLDNVADYRLIQTHKDITGSDPNAVNPATGSYQYQEIAGGITRATYANTLLPLINAQLNNGVFLINRQTAVEFCKWGRDEIGGELAQRILSDGINALEKFSFNGVPHIASIKSALIGTNHVYHWTYQDFLGRAFSMQEPTVYVKRERDTITVYASRKYGYGIGNVAGVARTVFT